jgi:hypothetical protein
MKTKISVLVLVLILTALACNLPAAATPAAVPLQASQTSTPPQLPAGITPTLTETDACKLFDEVKASRVLGESIPAIPASSPDYSSCTFFTNTGRGIYITITMRDQAKKNFLNEISQYQKGCSVSYSGGTSTATPFPPEIEALMSKSVLELFQMDIQMQVNCGGKVEPLPEFGPNAYAYLTPVAFKIGALAIVSGDNVYSFAYADPGLDIAQMVEKAREVARAAISPTPVEAFTPISEPTKVDVPTPVNSPTLVPTLPPTLISSPTLVPTLPATLVPTLVKKPTKIGKPTSVGPTPVGPTPVGPTPVGPTPVGPTPVGPSPVP